MIVKVNRIIQNPFSHALLMGFGGSGKRSCLRLAAFMQEYELHVLSIHNEFTYDDWYEFLREIFQDVGTKEIKSLFMIVDN